MKRLAFAFALAVAAAPVLAVRGGDATPVAEFAFDEGAGAFADDRVAGLSAALAPSAQWAVGPFGTALATGEPGAGADVPRLAALDGSDACTIFVRFRKESAGSGPYPNVLTSVGWEKGGGFMLFAPGGKSLSLRLRADGKGPEASWPVFAKIPEEKWTSVAVVFERPKVTVYADGKAVANGTWDHPFVFGDAVRLGGWGKDSFGGLIDDFCAWKGALAPAQVAALANDARHVEVEGYQDDGTGGIAKTRRVGQTGSPLATLDGEAATLVFDTTGCILSLREKAGGRELVAKPTPFLSATLEGGRTIGVRRVERRGESSFAFIFGPAGEVVVGVTPFAGGWTFEVTGATLEGVRSFELCRVEPACRKWIGSFANAWSDEKSAVCVRSYDLLGNPLANDRLRVEIDGGAPLVGRKAGLAAGPRAGFRRQLQAMTVAAGVPRSDGGGAWSADGDQARWSYVFANVEKGDVETWIDYVKRAGFANLHFGQSWTTCLGHAPINEDRFPGGLEGMRAAVEKIHAAGLRAGMHTLTACIAPNDSWITPVCSDELVADATYTLAEPLAPDATELLVRERPIDRHVNVFTYSSNGNVLRIGGELVQYTGIDRGREPYAFTGIRRGAFGTKRGGTWAAGTKVDYLHQRYIAFYPKPDSKLAEKLSDRLAEVYNFCKFDEFYFDGSEGMGTRYGIDAMRHKIYSKLHANGGRSPSIEASCEGANNWWFQTRMATTDHAVYGMKRFQDWHVGWAVGSGRDANFLEPQMGWWMPRTDVPRARGHRLDEMEYFAAKNAGNDAAMSLQGVGPRQDVADVRRQLTVLGWYEYPRLAKAFAPEAVRLMATPRTETRLRQGADGVWRLTEVESSVHRAAEPNAKTWTAESREARPAALRVEALYAAGAERDGEKLLAATAFKELAKASAGGVKTTLETDVKGEHGAAFRLTAENVSANPKGAWARASKDFGFSGVDLGKGRLAFGAWVKGDGSGALLNLQFRTPGAFVGGASDHYVRLDFTGWKYVTVLLRERDAAAHGDYRWPYGGYALIYRNFVDPRHLGTFSAYLNDVPKGKKATVEIGEVTALAQVPRTIEGATVEVNGVSFAVPFALASGEYAELDGGTWTKFSAMGDALVRVAVKTTPALKAGANVCALSGGGADAAARAEVTVFARGREIPAFGKLTDAMKWTMRYEGVMPFEYSPAKGLLAPNAIAVRPGEKARLSLAIYGPAANPTFTFPKFWGLSKTVCAFGATIAADERLVCRDGRSWFVEKRKTGEIVAKGTLAKPLPVLGKTTKFAFAATLTNDAPCVVDLLKEY